MIVKMKRKPPEPKELFVQRMHKLFPDEKEFKEYFEILQEQPRKSIRCNKLKISPAELKKQLEKKYNWKINQIWKDYPEVMVIESELEPGELGRALEHLLGYYYIQELASMLPVIAISPKPKDRILDLCAAPGSKTTQLASEMQNTGAIIANEVSLGRVRILASNLERCGATNTIISRKDGVALCKIFKKLGKKFNRILVDAPCSGEGTLRSSYKTYQMWNPNTIRTLSKIQKQLASEAFEILEKNGEMIYSTCTHAPEENEGIVDFMLEKYKDEIEIKKINLPIKPREGICCWESETYSDKVKKSCRVYPQDNDTEGFFLAKFRRTK